MIKCPTCGKEIRYILGSISSGLGGVPIPVNLTEITLISEKGWLVKGFAQHKCDIEEHKDNVEQHK